MSDFISRFSKELFRDVDAETIDPLRNRKWLIERVLERGRWEDWLLIRDHVPKEELRELEPRLRILRRVIFSIYGWRLPIHAEL